MVDVMCRQQAQSQPWLVSWQGQSEWCSVLSDGMSLQQIISHAGIRGEHFP